MELPPRPCSTEVTLEVAPAAHRTYTPTPLPMLSTASTGRAGSPPTPKTPRQPLMGNRIMFSGPLSQTARRVPEGSMAHL